MEGKHSLSTKPTGRAMTARDSLPRLLLEALQSALRLLLVSDVPMDLPRERVKGVRVLETLLLSSVEKWTSTRRAE